MRPRQPIGAGRYPRTMLTTGVTYAPPSRFALAPPHSRSKVHAGHVLSSRQDLE